MIETVMSMALPVGEVLRIKKNRLMPDGPLEQGKRLCIVTGIHGDEMGGQYICYELIRRIKAEYDRLTGIVDIYPALNPMGLDTYNRGFPTFDFDLNTMFPGSPDGGMIDDMAHSIVEELADANLCLDIHANNMHVKEAPHVRVNDGSNEKTMEYAKSLNLEAVWVHPSNVVKEGSLAYALNERGVPALVIESGIRMETDDVLCNKIVDGIFNTMKCLGVWSGKADITTEPDIWVDDRVEFINCDSTGLFIPAVSLFSQVKKGDLIGVIAKPILGAVIEEITAPMDGMIFTLRRYPSVREGAMIARIVGGSHD
ncbi:MAG: M14 family metallopeptidase [Lachnospiraceae bacterium]|nr:M14 family metallopeptidase [Lachnospiraceae bacterium]